MLGCEINFRLCEIVHTRPTRSAIMVVGSLNNARCVMPTENNGFDMFGAIEARWSHSLDA
jgi:hypothetical protein